MAKYVFVLINPPGEWPEPDPKEPIEYPLPDLGWHHPGPGEAMALFLTHPEELEGTFIVKSVTWNIWSAGEVRCSIVGYRVSEEMESNIKIAKDRHG